MRRRSIGFVALTALLLSISMGGRAYTPSSTDSPIFRGDNQHTAATAATSVFTDGLGGFAKVKWTANTTYPIFLIPPNVANMDGAGPAEIMASETDVRVQFAPTPNISLNHSVAQYNGATGAKNWEQDEGSSLAFVNSANIVEADGDAPAETIYWRGNPLVAANGSFVLRNNAGGQQWQYVDPAWSATENRIAILTAAQAANLDADATNEILYEMTNALLALSTPPQDDPACDNPNKIQIDVTNIDTFITALNGELGAPTQSWSFHLQPGLVASTPVVVDGDGDGKNDVILGLGSPQGKLIDECEVDVTLDSSAFDNRVVAMNQDKHAEGNFVWEYDFEEPIGTNRPPTATPTVVGTTPGGKPLIVFLMPIDPVPPASSGDEYNILVALDGSNGAEQWRSTAITPATLAPIAAGNLDGVGQPEIVIQVGNRLEAWSNVGVKLWETSTVGNPRNFSSAGPVVADIDEDGALEVLAVRDSSATIPARLAVFSGATGVEEWSKDVILDDVIGAPVVADVDRDDNGLAEIVFGVGSLTVTDGTAHTGKVIVWEPNAPDIDPVVTCGPPTCSRVNGEAQTVHVQIHNAGTRDVPVGTLVRLLDNGSTVADQAIASPLAPAASTTLTYSWTPSTSGSHTLTGVGDPTDTVRELVETNNTGSTTVVTGVPPTADFTFSPATPTEIQTVQFTDTSTVDGTGTPPATIVSRQWSCSDGFASTAAGPSHKFADGGSYTCTLEVTDSRGFSDTSDAKTIDVSHVSPVAKFSSSVTSPGNVQFTDSSTHPNSPQDAPPTGWSYAWEFGDGGTSTVRNPSHDYGVTTGFFAVHLTVTDNDGQSDDITKTIDVASTLITRTGPWDEEIVAVSERPDILGFGTADGEAGANLETGEITATATVTQTTLPTGVILDGLPPIGASIATGSGSLRALVNVAEAGPHRVTVTMQIDSAAALGGAVFPLGSASSSASATAAAALATCTGPVCMVLPATQVSAQQALACRPGTCTHGPTVTFTMILNVPAPGPVAIDGGLVTTASIRGAGEASAVASAHLLSVTVGPA